MPPQIELREALRAEIPDTVYDAQRLADLSGEPLSRVLRKSLLAGVRSDSDGLEAAVRLLSDAVEVDEDTGGYSTGALLGRLAKGATPEVVVDLLQACLRADIVVPLDRLGVIADAFANKGRLDLVKFCHEYAEGTGQPINAFLWAATMRAHQVASDADGAVRTFAQVPSPTVHHLTPFIDTLIAARRYGEAVEAWEAFDKRGTEGDNPSLLIRIAAAIADTRQPGRAAAFTIQQIQRGVPFRPAMFTPLFSVFARQQQHVPALELVEAIRAQGIPLSDRNLDDFVSTFRGISDPAILIDLAPRLNRLLRRTHWARLISTSLLPGDFNPEWLHVVKGAFEFEKDELAGMPVVENLSPGLYSKLLSICVSASDRGSLRWLIRHRKTVSVEQFQVALRLASSLGEAELARQLVAEMFQRGVKPDRSIFELAGESYSGSLSAVPDRFKARVRTEGGGNPEALAQLFVSVVLQVYAETNQASQANHILAKFDGWPPLTSWDVVEVSLLEVSSRRSEDVNDFIAALEPTLGRVPDRLRGRAALEVARTGNVVALRALLGDRQGRRELTRRRAEVLCLANAYHRLDRGRSYFRSPPRSNARGDNWIPNVADEVAMVEALCEPIDLKRARDLWSRNGEAWASALPLTLCLHFLRQARRPSNQTGRILDALSIRFPDSRGIIEEVADLLDLRAGLGEELLSRLLQPAADVTYPRAEAYIRSALPEPADQERALARFKASAREIPPGGRPQLLLRVVVDALALNRQPEAIRRVFAEFTVLTEPDWQSWAHLQVAHDDDPELVLGVTVEMTRAGTTPHLRNHRLVVRAFTRTGRLDDAEAYVASNQTGLSAKEVVSLVGQVLVAAANVDDLDRAKRLRDRIWEMSEALPTGAEAALHDARVRAGLDNPIVGTAAESVQLKLDSFVQDFAHDLHNMLGRVWVRVENAIEVLEENGDVEVALRQLTPIETAAREPIQERLDHWRTVADADAADEENCDVAQVVRRVFALYRRETNLGVRFECTINPGAVMVRMSTFQLDLVLRHLIDNAVKHLRRVDTNRLVEVRASEVGAETSHDGQRWIRISVYDSGPGIPPEHRTAIYESGFTTNPERGIGRGLAIVNGVIKATGASISVESRSEAECVDGQHSFTQFNLMVPPSIA
ncbi:hypothetical protein NOK12_11880 [Nocardioides sp. OK12]|uniref:ATP-binding protein n=1 Tax=Nocardioides sp. OK12 TaxID=2758661 RepID=UPI0021C4219A|nr:ATP-binding protein [Nocardioides sp. OK12]GHJ58670.1 hypothetical protein NOK12_11880 [Nocardioides sp. OK12]